MSYELVICIVNSGFAGEVMDAAKDAGAGGGTIIRGRGTAAKEAEAKEKAIAKAEEKVLKATEKVDLAVALVMALDRAMRSGSAGSVYEGRGMLFI